MCVVVCLFVCVYVCCLCVLCVCEGGGVEEREISEIRPTLCWSFFFNGKLSTNCRRGQTIDRVPMVFEGLGKSVGNDLPFSKP